MKVQEVLNSKLIILNIRKPLTVRGFFYERKNMTDYTKLNNRIVRQAWEVSNLLLTEEMKTRLFENKIRRAAEMIRAREPVVYHQVED